MKGQAAHYQIHKIQILQLINIAGTLEVSRIGRLIDIKPGNMETVLTQMQKAEKIVRSGNRIALDCGALEDVSPSSDAVMRVFSDFIHRSDYYTASGQVGWNYFQGTAGQYASVPVSEDVGSECSDTYFRRCDLSWMQAAFPAVFAVFTAGVLYIL